MEKQLLETCVVNHSNAIIQEMASTGNWYQTMLKKILREFSQRISEETHFTYYSVKQDFPSGRYIILAKGYLGGEYAYRMYGMTAFEVYLNGKMNEELSKTWRFILRNYFGTLYVEVFCGYVKSIGLYEKYQDELNFLLYKYEKDPNRRIYLPC